MKCKNFCLIYTPFNHLGGFIPLYFLGQVFKWNDSYFIMNWIKDKDNFKPIGFTNLKKNIKVLKQIGKSNFLRDSKRKALLPGKRTSKNGNIYYEDRKNRSDAKGSRI